MIMHSDWGVRVLVMQAAGKQSLFMHSDLERTGLDYA